MQGNSVSISGNMTADPVLTYVGKDNIPFVRFSIARSWRSGEVEQPPEFFNVKAWRNVAINLAASVRKGDRVVITGHLQHNTWVAQDGSNRQSVDIVADEVAPSLVFAQATLMATAGKNAGVVREPGAPTPDQSEADEALLDELSEIV